MRAVLRVLDVGAGNSLGPEAGLATTESLLTNCTLLKLHPFSECSEWFCLLLLWVVCWVCWCGLSMASAAASERGCVYRLF